MTADEPADRGDERVRTVDALGELELFDLDNPDASVRSTVRASDVLDETARKFGGR